MLLATAGPAWAQGVDPNPCLDPAQAPALLCPDFVMGPPSDIKADRRSDPGEVYLRATNRINSRGLGPAELRGRRSGPVSMQAVQRIVRRDGGRLVVRTGARLLFKAIPRQGRFWKFEHAARFELWALDALGNRVRRVRTGPKQVYCLRDLTRTRRSANSPGRRIYPGCNKNPRQRAVTLGTSVGWSDIYPASYYEQYIDVTGLRGCFAYLHWADPRNRLYELDELNNVSQTVVRLPWRGGGKRGCPGRTAVLLGLARPAPGP
jgi:hypothetical protein